MRVAVTGGSGVVGGAVIRHLVSSGHEVFAASRSTGSDTVLTGLGAEPVRCDVLEPDSLARLCDGAELLFHVAGINQMCVDDPGPMLAANVDGSVNAVRAAALHGVSRVVYTSSAAAIGEMPGTVGSETSAHRGWFLSEYERSKFLAEEAVLALDVDVEIVAVNPSSVQGPGRATGTGKLILDTVNGRMPFLVDTDLSIVDIDDCARGHLLAAEFGEDRARYVLNSFTLGMRDAIALLESATGRSIGVRLLPAGLVGAVAPLVDLARRALRRDLPFCGEMVRTMAHGHRYDGGRAAAELGLEYTSPEEIIGRLIRWFETEGLLGAGPN